MVSLQPAIQALAYLWMCPHNDVEVVPKVFGIDTSVGVPKRQPINEVVQDHLVVTVCKQWRTGVEPVSVAQDKQLANVVCIWFHLYASFDYVQ